MVGTKGESFKLVFEDSFFSESVLSAPQKIRINSDIKPQFKILRKRGHKRIVLTGYSFIGELI